MLLVPSIGGSTTRRTGGYCRSAGMRLLAVDEATMEYKVTQTMKMDAESLIAILNFLTDWTKTSSDPLAAHLPY